MPQCTTCLGVKKYHMSLQKHYTISEDWEWVYYDAGQVIEGRINAESQAFLIWSNGDGRFRKAVKPNSQENKVPRKMKCNQKMYIQCGRN